MTKCCLFACLSVFVGPSVSFGMLKLVELLWNQGSERLSASGSCEDAVLLKEAQSINKSLSCLGTVIQALANKVRRDRNAWPVLACLGSAYSTILQEKHVPFRDSKLTYLLQPALGGDCKTLMICNLSPAPDNRHGKMSLRIVLNQSRRPHPTWFVNRVTVLATICSKGEFLRDLVIVLSSGWARCMRACN